jgi:hypothetical protein
MSNMQNILIDSFIVPEESKASFLKKLKAAAYLRTMPGIH